MLPLSQFHDIHVECGQVLNVYFEVKCITKTKCGQCFNIFHLISKVLCCPPLYGSRLTRLERALQDCGSEEERVESSGSLLMTAHGWD